MSEAVACHFYGTLIDPPFSFDGRDQEEWLKENGFEDLDTTFSGNAVCGYGNTYICIKETLRSCFEGQAERAVQSGFQSGRSCDDYNQRIAEFFEYIGWERKDGDWTITACLS